MRITTRELVKVMRRLPAPEDHPTPIINMMVYPDARTAAGQAKIVTFTQRKLDRGRRSHYREWVLEVI